MARILIADPDPATQQDLLEHLRRRGHDPVLAEDGAAALRTLTDEDVDLVLAELQLPGMDGLQLLREAHRLHADQAFILLAAFGTVEDAVAAMREGADDFLSKPLSAEEVSLAIERALDKARLLRENQDLRAALDDRLRLFNLVGGDAKMTALFKTARAVAGSRSTVLITGESGTGKTLLARAIHSLSPRGKGPFVEVNCGALPESLLESELFGHVRGAFTGAVKDRAGKFEAAHGGTIFLDEIGTSSPGFQVKLLRVLQDRVLERVGDSRPIPVDVRVILATNSDLAEAVQAGTFRADLYYRIHVVNLHVPPLRERRSDVPVLAERFLQRFAHENQKTLRGIAPDALRILEQAEWPGNVRQLENVMERAVVLAEGDVITPADLPEELTRRPGAHGTEPGLPHDAHLLPLRAALEVAEKALLQRALEHHGGNRLATAESLGINRSTLFHKMRRYGLS
ncbi:MAG: sigma-54-dependent Fis family transcriptional regulator [Planctomycetes bacterium]|nr:sigma-54-dependent Fis family transcriptional regulator [Planctomycetota bacterium]